jgi:hypothetical protein
MVNRFATSTAFFLFSIEHSRREEAHMYWLRYRRWQRLLNGDTGAALGFIIGIIAGSVLLNVGHRIVPNPVQPPAPAIHDAASDHFGSWTASAGS